MATSLAVSPNMTANCPCGRPDNADRNMVACDMCDAWYHFQCAGVSEEIKNLPWICNQCKAAQNRENVPNIVEQPPSQDDNLSIARSEISSIRSHSTSSVMLGLQLLDEDFQRKQNRLVEEKALQERKLKLEEEFAKKQQELQEEHIRKRRELLQAQSRASGGGSHVSIRSSDSSVRKWLAEQFSQATGDPRGAIPKERPSQNPGTLPPLPRPSQNPGTQPPTETPPQNPIAQQQQSAIQRNMPPIPVINVEKSADIGNTVQTPGLSIPLQFDDDLERSFFQLQMGKNTGNVPRNPEWEFPKLTPLTALPTAGQVGARTKHPLNDFGKLPRVEERLRVEEQPRVQEQVRVKERARVRQTRVEERVDDHPRFEELHRDGERTRANNAIRGALVPYGLGQAGGPTALQLAARHAMPKKLPPFSGKPEEWPFFISNFITTTEACGYSDAENLARLQECLKGKALEGVRSRLLLPNSVPEVIETLRRRYGRPELLLEVMIEKVEECDAPKLSNLETFGPFSEVVEQLCDHLEATNQREHLMNPTLLKKLVLKLPSEIALKWARCKRDVAPVNLRTFADFMSMVAEDVREVLPPSSASRSTNKQPNDRRNDKKTKEKGFIHAHGNSATTQENKVNDNGKSKANTSSNPRPCRICESIEHRIRNCDTFKKLNKAEKMKMVEKWKLCHICLNEHGGIRCRFNIQCNVDRCQERHNPLLHESLKKETSTQASATVANQNTHSEKHRPVVFRLIAVTLYHEGRSVEATAFIDEGSSMSLIERDLVDQLGVKNGTAEPLHLIWTANISRDEKDSRKISIQISAKGQRQKHHLKLRTVSELQLPVQQINIAAVASKYQHLRDISVAGQIGTPKLLLGLDNLHLFAPTESRIGEACEPIAVKSRLGWAIYGPMCGIESRYAVVGVHAANEITNQELHDLMREHFAMEAAGVTAIPIESDENKRAREILQKTTVRIGNRFETGLIWKTDNHSFPNSYPMARWRLKQFEKKLSKNPALAENVKQQIAEYLQKGYAHKATPEELAESDPRKVWYIPINVVINPKKPSKVRIVWDAAAEVEGVSLNSSLLKGPDLLVCLLAVLCHFRERLIAFGGDLEAMYHQVRIRTADKQAQRFLFRSDSMADPEIYVMDVATFGATCSPTSAQFVKNKNANEYASQFPDAAAAIKERHYVDDYFDSTDTEEEAIQRAQDVKFIHAQGGFHIRNWVSNSTRFLQELGEPVQQDTVQFTSDKHTNVERVLGITWNPSEDVFCFSIPCNDDLEQFISGQKRPTKCIVLKFLMSFFDPLGLVAPFLIHGKILMQDIWRSGNDWKDEIDDDCFKKWTQWIELLPRLEELKIPRGYFGPTLSSEIESIELHVFTDASELAYGCAAYFRIEHAGQVRCVLVMAKTKVAPLKLLSIPRLELEGTLLGVRLATTVESYHSLPIKRRIFWTDSATVMSWIQSDQRKYKAFVAFRLGELLDRADPSEFRKVPTKHNVADELTKRNRNFSCSENDRWLRGPEFLYLDEQHWPHQEKPAANTSEELRATFLLHDVRVPVPLIDVSRISRWKTLVRSVACIFRFVSNCRRKARGEPIEAVPVIGNITKSIIRANTAIRVPLKQEECAQAENCLWRQAQSEVYSEEIKILLKNRELPPENWFKLETSSSLKTLSPFIDEDGVLRMQGRTEEAELLTFDQRCPIILPRGHEVTNLLIESYHQKAGHGRNETAVNDLRQRFYISALRACVNKVAKGCQRCKIRKCTPQTPRMAALPKQRVSPYLRPFSFVGIDYCGPVPVTVGRRREKRWIVVFTCFNTRAIHLEVAHSLTTQSCLMAIKRFMCRFGPVREIFSDNGTNFRGADNQGVLMRRIHEDCADAVVDSRLKWHFNPPSAPHMGGVWERMVRSVKEAIRSLDEGCRLTDEILLTTLAEAAEMINSRPLTYQPLDPDCPEALTPNHFLRVGPSNGELILEPATLAQALRDTYQRSQYLADLLWKRWLEEYMPAMNKRPKWHDEAIPLQPGDLVFVADENHRQSWIRGIVKQVFIGNDKRIRSAIVETSRGTLKRPVTKLALAEVSSRHL